MAAADNNVRPRRRVLAASARRARCSVLARLLLHVAEPLRLYRKFLLLLVVPLMPACIIPIGPDWHDPDGVANYPPEIISWNPPNNMIVTGAIFTVTARDPNVGDQLHFRWIVDYPGEFADIRPPDDRPLGGPDGQVSSSGFRMDCDFHKLSDRLAFHQLRVVVADRPFIDDDPTDLAKVEAPGRYDDASWIWNVSCPPPLPPPSSPTP